MDENLEKTENVEEKEVEEVVEEKNNETKSNKKVKNDKVEVNENVKEDVSNINVMNVKNNEFDFKKIVAVIALLAFFVAAIIGVYWYINRDKDSKAETIKNTNKEVISESVLNGLKINDVKIETTNGMTVYKGTLENLTKEVIPVNGVSATFYENEKEVGTIEMYINKELEPGEKAELNNYSDMDFSRATNVKYQVIS
ncbi:MAG: hypothetical protein E7158_03425 [Firmicutes bacterium]|nr:hypothetical protein [Bacillota bacterium]